MYWSRKVRGDKAGGLQVTLMGGRGVRCLVGRTCCRCRCHVSGLSG